MNSFQKLDQLSALAKADPCLRKRILATHEAKEPMEEFCTIAKELGIDLSVGELFAIGLEYSDNQCKSTNGGNPSPYEAFDDAYENFIASVSY